MLKPVVHTITTEPQAKEYLIFSLKYNFIWYIYYYYSNSGEKMQINSCLLYGFITIRQQTSVTIGYK